MSTVLLQDNRWSPMGGGHWGGGMAGMWLFWILALVVLVAIPWLFLRHRGRESGESPEEILRERYARGEIDHDTFERMRNELQATRRPG